MLKEKKRNTHVVHESVRETYNAWNKEHGQSEELMESVSQRRITDDQQ